MNKLAEGSKKAGLSLNMSKTGCMKDLKTAQITVRSIYCKGLKKIKQVNCLQYPDYTVASDERCDTEISKIIAYAIILFTTMSNVLENSSITSSKMC